MTLDEAIIHAEKVAEFSDRECIYESFYGEKEMKRKCAEEHRQLADWLKLLRRILESGDCNECAIQKMCNVRPEWGEQVRYNCHMFVRKEVNRNE